jgi:molecular chaperone HscB
VSSAVQPCWSCGGPVDAASVFCSTCKVVQPPRQADHFERLGVPRTLGLAQADLDRGYFALQRRLHPDRFAGKSPRERAISQQQAAALNEAYETLKDPLSRAMYLAALSGVEMPADGKTIDDPDLLMEAMEAREALMEADTPQEVEKLANDAERRAGEGLRALDDLFLRGEAPAIRKALLRLRYLEKFADEVRTRRHKIGLTDR